MKSVLPLPERGALIAILLAVIPFSSAKSQLFDLAPGPYKVGFKHVVKEDKSRSYSRIYDWDTIAMSRPIPISVWYPIRAEKGKTVITVKDYMTILKEEEEWEHLPDSRILSWFYYADNDKNRAHMQRPTNAYKADRMPKGKFPVVIYAPSYQASSVENFSLCEFLASHGYIVISSPSRGNKNRFLNGGTPVDIETQARDIEFLIGEVQSYPNADIGKLAVMGYSFGGISNILAQMSNDRVRALVCLDGSIKYQFEKLLACASAEMSSVDVPFLFMSQKNIPLKVMIEDEIDTTLNNHFAFFDSLRNVDAYYFKFHDLTHPHFSTMGVLFQDRDLRQDKSDSEIYAQYRLVNTYTLKFLDAYLRSRVDALQFLNNIPDNDTIRSISLKRKYKTRSTETESFEQFHVKARQQNYKDLMQLYSTLRLKSPALKIEEWKLNNLGLQLLFRNESDASVAILTLATLLYPDSANAFDSLAEAYLVLGKFELAKLNYQKSLQLDISNQNAIEKLKSIEKVN